MFRVGTRTLIFDVETTGLASYDRVVSVAGVWCDGLEPTQEHFYFVFNPRKSCHPMAAAAHGLADWWLRFQPPFECHAAEMRAMFERADLVVGHNVGFDIRMMNHEFGKCGAPELTVDWFCTMQAFRQQSAGPANLDACLSSIGLSRSTSTHSAFEDTFLTMNLYRWLKGEKTCCPAPSPLPPPTNVAAVPKHVAWADRVDAMPNGLPCSPTPECVIATLARLGIDVAGHSARTTRMLLAAHDYAAVLVRRTPAEESRDQIRMLICSLADSPEFADMLREWSRWSWGRPNPQIPHDALREFAEDVLAGCD
jgi:DNA polymerase-3 subunit epsilon